MRIPGHIRALTMRLAETDGHTEEHTRRLLGELGGFAESVHRRVHNPRRRGLMRTLLGAMAVALLVAAPLHAEQRPLPASMKCPLTLAVADGTYTLTLNEQDTLAYNLDSYHVACVWGLGDKRISFSVNWSESTKYRWWYCGRQYNDGSNFASKTKRANAVLGINQALATPIGQSQQAAVLTVLERFLDAAEARAAPCTAPKPAAPAHATLQKWSVSVTSGGMSNSGHVALFSVKGAGTFRLSAQKKPTAATGTIRVVLIHTLRKKRIGVDLHVVGASAYRRSASVERITLHVRVTDLHSGDENCLEHDIGTVTLVDGYGAVDDLLTFATVCGLNGSDPQATVTIR